MNEALKKHLELLPIGIPFIYVLGFVSINGYLSNFGFSDTDLLNFSYLKSGVVTVSPILVVFVMLKFSFSEQTMTDDLRRSWPSLLIAIHNMFFMTMLFSVFLVVDSKSFPGGGMWRYLFMVSMSSYLLFRLWAMNKRPTNNLGVFLLMLPAIILCAITVSILCYFNKYALYVLILFSVLTWTFSVSFGDYGDKNYNARIIMDIIVVVVVSYFFGKYIYASIPGKFGGASEHKIVVANCAAINSLVNENRQLDTLTILYQNENRMLVEDVNRNLIFLDRNELKAYRILPSDESHK